MGDEGEVGVCKGVYIGEAGHLLGIGMGLAEDEVVAGFHQWRE